MKEGGQGRSMSEEGDEEWEEKRKQCGEGGRERIRKD